MIHRLRARAQASPRYRWIVLTTVLFGLFAVGLSFTILSTVLPVIGSEFGVNETVSHWVVTAPILTFGIAGPIVGKVGDIYGAKRPFLIGFGLATLFLVLTGLAWNIGSLIVFRVFGALEGAATGPCSVKYIATHFPPEERSKAFGWWSTVAAGAPTVGLVAGTAVVPLLGWRAIFFLQAPMCLAALVVAWIVLDDTEKQPHVKVDVTGSVLLGLSMFCGLFALNQGFATGWNPLLVGMVAAAPFLFAAFVVSQRRSTHPLFPLRYFRRRNFSLSLAGSTLVNVAYLGGFIIAPFLLSGMLGYGSGEVLAVLVTRPLAFTVVAVGAGYAVAHIGERVGAVVGAGLICLGMVVLALLTPTSTVQVVVLGLASAGVGLGFASPSLNTSITNAVDLEDQAVAGGMSASVQAIGGALGNVVLVGILHASVPGGDVEGAPPAVLEPAFRRSYLVGAAVALVATLLALGLRRTARSAEVGAAGEDLTAIPPARELDVVETGEFP